MMQDTATPSTGFIDTKPHFHILDGLRGVAALLVVWFHIFEAFATSHLDYIISHGYLAVDFFFILSGFVVAYAYDARMGRGAMGAWEFIKRRLIRLHPMVAMSAVIGGALFYLQVSNTPADFWDVSCVAIGTLALFTILNAFLIPVSVGMEQSLRGFGEMYPLNGPSWSLFFEYLVSILYVLLIRRLPTIALGVLVLASAGALGYQAISTTGDICQGFSLTGEEFYVGFLRVMFSFSAGLLLFRLFKPARVKATFWICSVLLVALMAFPRLGGEEARWMNGIYETLCVVVFFPILVYLGASDQTKNPLMIKICKFLGELSYPLYMVHYPIFWLYFVWVKNNNLSVADSMYGALGVFFGSIALAIICNKFYDIPVRALLSKRFLKKNAKQL